MNMNQLKSMICAAVIIGSVSSTAVAAATVYPPEGGQWNYGVSALGSFSDYINPTLTHGSSVSYNGEILANDIALPGAWSQALALGHWSGCAFWYNI